MAKIGPNQPCPCGSSRKFKKCCGEPNAPARRLPHTATERASAIQKLDELIDTLFEEEEEDAFEEFWGRHVDREDELPPDLLVMSRDAYDAWLAFDHELDDGRRFVDHVIEKVELTPGERAFLEALRDSSVRLYEVVETVPGSSVTLRDLLEGTTVTVGERTASRTLSRSDAIAARVIPRGASGRPEMEFGILPITALVRAPLLDAMREHKKAYVAEVPGASIDEVYKAATALIFDAWLVSIFEPPIPQLANTDGELLVLTRVSFHVSDAEGLRRALDGAAVEGVEPSGEQRWLWAGASAKRETVTLGMLTIRGDVLTVETNSAERGARARALIERLAPDHVRYRATTHEDVRSQVVRDLKEKNLGRGAPPDGAEREQAAIDPAIAEALVAQHLGRHYRTWVDEPVPALDGKTPREAAKLGAYKERVARLIRDLEGSYERALKDGQPAYDPSWMWGELGIEERGDPSETSPMAHERVYEQVPGAQEAAGAAADRIRARPSFSDATTTASEADLDDDLELQRFLRRGRASDNDAASEGGIAVPYMPLLVDLELHRRKVFWVDAALSFMLESTEIDVLGRELRVPFPSFALFFEDRHALSLGERLLARRAGDPLRGQILRALTVYVTEGRAAAARTLLVTFAFDALGPDLPSLVRYEVPVDDDASVSTFLESVEPRAVVSPDIPDASPARGLLRLVLNGILYATSANVTVETRALASGARRRRASSSPVPMESDSVFFLPGTIDIQHIRQLQAVARAPDGGALLARFMVRGHWRRPAKTWTDQRLRWIEPYWKGPSIAAVIEKAYRLTARP